MTPVERLLEDIDAREIEALEAAKTRWALEEDRLREAFERRRNFARKGYGQ